MKRQGYGRTAVMLERCILTDALPSPGLSRFAPPDGIFPAFFVYSLATTHRHRYADSSIQCSVDERMNVASASNHCVNGSPYLLMSRFITLSKEPAMPNEYPPTCL